MSSKRIRILRVTEQAILGGEQRHILDLLTNLDPDRYDQSACSEPTGPFVDEVQRLGIPHIPVTMCSKFDLQAMTTIYSGVALTPLDHLVDGHEKRREWGISPDTPLVCAVGSTKEILGHFDPRFLTKGTDVLDIADKIGEVRLICNKRTSRHMHGFLP